MSGRKKSATVQSRTMRRTLHHLWRREFLERFGPILRKPPPLNQIRTRLKIIRRQKTFELMSLGPVGIQHLDRWRPLRTETLEGFWLFFDVDLDRDVVVIDEALDAGVGVDLGIQPSAGSSHRSCVEVY
jgi:hypothetical protein